MYGIEKFSDLTPLLGEQWFIRILKDQMNFCYVNKESVAYYLRKRRSLVEYSEDGERKEVNGGYVLVFNFVRMGGL